MPSSNKLDSSPLTDPVAPQYRLSGVLPYEDDLSTERRNDLVGVGSEMDQRPHTLLFGPIRCRLILENYGEATSREGI